MCGYFASWTVEQSILSGFWQGKNPLTYLWQDNGKAFNKFIEVVVTLWPLMWVKAFNMAVRFAFISGLCHFLFNKCTSIEVVVTLWPLMPVKAFYIVRFAFISSLCHFLFIPAPNELKINFKIMQKHIVSPIW